MHEHFRNLRLGWIAFGWFIAVSITSLLLLTLTAFGITGPDAAGEPLWVAASLLVGFLVTGFFVGTRVNAAPILHGVAIALFSLGAWVVVNLVGEPFGQTSWGSLPAGAVAGLLALQGAAAVTGTRLGVRWMRTPPGAG